MTSPILKAEVSLYCAKHCGQYWERMMDWLSTTTDFCRIVVKLEWAHTSSVLWPCPRTELQRIPSCLFGCHQAPKHGSHSHFYALWSTWPSWPALTAFFLVTEISGHELSSVVCLLPQAQHMRGSIPCAALWHKLKPYSDLLPEKKSLPASGWSFQLL